MCVCVCVCVFFPYESIYYVHIIEQFFYVHGTRASLIYSSITNKMQRYTMVFITINAVHVSCGSFAHHQELKSVHTTSGIC